LVVRLALRYHVNKSALNIGRQRERFGERVGGRVKKRCTARGIGSERQNQVSCRWRAITIIIMRERVKLKLRCPKQRAGKSGIDQIAEINPSVLRGIEQGRVIGEVAFNMPRARHYPRRLRRSAKVDVDAANPDFGSTIKLPPGLNGEIRGQDHLCPRPRAAVWRLKRKKLGREVVESNVVKELDNTWSRVWPRYRRIGKCRVGRSDHESRRRDQLRGKNTRAEQKHGGAQSADD